MWKNSRGMKTFLRPCMFELCNSGLLGCSVNRLPSWSAVTKGQWVTASSFNVKQDERVEAEQSDAAQQRGGRTGTRRTGHRANETPTGSRQSWLWVRRDDFIRFTEGHENVRLPSGPSSPGAAAPSLGCRVERRCLCTPPGSAVPARCPPLRCPISPLYTHHTHTHTRAHKQRRKAEQREAQSAPPVPLHLHLNQFFPDTWKYYPTCKFTKIMVNHGEGGRSGEKRVREVGMKAMVAADRGEQRLSGPNIGQNKASDVQGRLWMKKCVCV